MAIRLTWNSNMISWRKCSILRDKAKRIKEGERKKSKIKDPSNVDQILISEITLLSLSSVFIPYTLQKLLHRSSYIRSRGIVIINKNRKNKELILFSIEKATDRNYTAQRSGFSIEIPAFGFIIIAESSLASGGEDDFYSIHAKIIFHFGKNSNKILRRE